jgi:hypothetical protein
MDKEIIAVKQLPIIVEQLHEVKAEVTAKVEQALSLVCAEDTVKDVKKVRSELNKELKDYEERRKAVKTAIMKPYNDFEEIYKDCISDTYKKADTELKGKIDSVENELKEKKRKEVWYYFEELCEANSLDFITFENANINVTLSASMKSLKDQAKNFVFKVVDDLNLIDTQEHKDEIMYEYKQSLNVSNAITTVANRYKAIEKAKAREEERKAREQAEAEAAAKVEEVVEAVAPPTVEPIAPPAPAKVQKFSFTVTASESRIEKLIDFLESEEFDYERI